MDVDLSDVAVDIGRKEGKFRFHGIACRSAYWMEAKRTLVEFARHRQGYITHKRRKLLLLMQISRNA